MQPNPLRGDYENQEYDSFVEGEPGEGGRRRRSGNMPAAAPVPVKSNRVENLLEFLVVLVGLSLLPQSVILGRSFFTSTPATSTAVQVPGTGEGWTEWVEVAACSQACGGGVRKVEREKNCTAATCGSKFGLLKAKETEELSCNTDPCSGPVDGGWGPWSCTNGTISRTCSLPPPAHGGKPCQEPETRIQAANRTGFTCTQEGELHTAYKMAASKLNKSVCEGWCTSMGAEIPTVLTQEENEETQRYNTKGGWIWLAAEKSGTERSTYTWDNGKKWEFPNNDGWTPTWNSANDAGAKCLRAHKALKWMDLSCSYSYTCACRV